MLNSNPVITNQKSLHSGVSDLFLKNKANKKLKKIKKKKANNQSGRALKYEKEQDLQFRAE